MEAAHSLAQWDSGPLGQFYARKAREKSVPSLASSLHILLDIKYLYVKVKNDE